MGIKYSIVFGVRHLVGGDSNPAISWGTTAFEAPWRLVDVVKEIRDLKNCMAVFSRRP